MPLCSVINCEYRNAGKSSLRIFRLPQGLQPFLVNQRRLWQHAVREANGGTGPLLANPLVCAAHFISGKASSDFESPDFVPSVFPCAKKGKTRSQENETHSHDIKTRSQGSKTSTPESSTHTPERRTRSQDMKNCTPKGKTSTPERRTQTPEHKIQTPERKTQTPERRTHTPESRTRSQESKINSQGIKTRSQVCKLRIQQRENRKRKKNWTFFSRKRRYRRARSKGDDSALDLQPSAFKDAQHELSEEEEQTTLSPSVLQEEETLTDAEKVSFHSKTTSRLNGVPASIPAEITALLKRPILRLKRVAMPTVEFRCESCSETFTSSSLLEEHKKVHDENSHFICEICGMRFVVQEEFAKHQSDHPKLEPYFPCNMCNRSFSTVQHLKRHKLLHIKDGRKCPKCGTLFCQRHNHVLYLPRPKVRPESKRGSEESQRVESDVTKKKDSPVRTERSQVTAAPPSAKKTQLVIPKTTSPVVTVSVIPVRGGFREGPMASPPPPNVESLPQISLKTEEPSPLRRICATTVFPPAPPVLPSSLPTPTPTPPPPPPPQHSSDDIHQSVQPEIEAPSTPPVESFVPDLADFPPSLKMFSPQYLTSTLLEVKRNYEYIFYKPKQKKKKPLAISSRNCVIKLRQRIAYDLEVVL